MNYDNVARVGGFTTSALDTSDISLVPALLPSGVPVDFEKEFPTYPSEHRYPPHPQPHLHLILILTLSFFLTLIMHPLQVARVPPRSDL